MCIGACFDCPVKFITVLSNRNSNEMAESHSLSIYIFMCVYHCFETYETLYSEIWINILQMQCSVGTRRPIAYAEPLSLAIVKWEKLKYIMPYCCNMFLFSRDKVQYKEHYHCWLQSGVQFVTTQRPCKLQKTRTDLSLQKTRAELYIAFVVATGDLSANQKVVCTRSCYGRYTYRNRRAEGNSGHCFGLVRIIPPLNWLQWKWILKIHLPDCPDP